MLKKFLTALTVIGMLGVTATGCTDISDAETNQTPVVLTAAPEETANANASEEASAVDTVTDTESTEAVDADAVTADSKADADTSDTASAESSDSAETIGDTGMTATEWIAQAQQIYTTAAQTYYTYLCSSNGFTYDTQDTVDNGSYVRITDYSTIEEAEAEYYSVFAQTGHESDFDGMFQEIDGKLYGRMGDRGTDIYYVSSEVTALTDSTSDTLTFSVTSHYQDPESADAYSEESPFTLIFERGVWRVGQFVMPY